LIEAIPYSSEVIASADQLVTFRCWACTIQYKKWLIYLVIEVILIDGRANQGKLESRFPTVSKNKSFSSRAALEGIELDALWTVHLLDDA